MNLQETIEISRKMDMYGVLLTEKQQQVLNSYVNYNGSISEIAEDLGTTRQAVLDLIKRTVAKLDDYENRLKFCKKLDKIYNNIPKMSIKLGLTKIQEKDIMKLVKSMEE